MNSLMQSLNKKHIIYYSVISGLVLNLVLDVPCMYLFKALGTSAYYGAVFATLCGFILSNTMSLIYLKKNMKLSYNETLRALPRALISLVILIGMGMVFNLILPVESTSRFVQIINIAVSGIVCGGVYFVISLKTLKTILPEKLLKKLHLA